jgi:hypothetical protein
MSRVIVVRTSIGERVADDLSRDSSRARPLGGVGMYPNESFYGCFACFRR